MAGTKLTNNFTLEEFLVNQTEKPSKEIIEKLKSVAYILQRYRDTIFNNKPVTIYSGWRSEKYNKLIPGAAASSYHTKGMAADFGVKGLSKRELYDLMNKVHFGGVEFYNNENWTICHIDIRGYNARFDNNNKVLPCTYNIEEHNKIFH